MGFYSFVRDNYFKANDESDLMKLAEMEISVECTFVGFVNKKGDFYLKQISKQREKMEPSQLNQLISDNEGLIGQGWFPFVFMGEKNTLNDSINPDIDEYIPNGGEGNGLDEVLKGIMSVIYQASEKKKSRPKPHRSTKERIC